MLMQLEGAVIMPLSVVARQRKRPTLNFGALGACVELLGRYSIDCVAVQFMLQTIQSL